MTENVYITGIASFLPGKPVPNDEMESLLGVVGDKPSRSRKIVLKSNGICSRHYAIDRETLEPTHTNAQLTAEAVRNLSSDEFSIDSIDCLASGTSIPDQLMPNHAVMVHGELGNPTCEVVATSGVCTSGMTSMRYASMGVQLGFYKNAVATGSELASAVLRAQNFEIESAQKIEALMKHPSIAFEKDFLRWMLSDGAGAVLLQPEPRQDGHSLRIDWIELKSYANEMEACMYAGAEKVGGHLIGWTRYDQEERAAHSVMAVKQDVRLLDENVIHYTLEKPLASIARERCLTPSDYDWFVPHYSSNYFKDKVYAGLQKIGFEIPYAKWYSNLAQKGNVGAASIYLLLEGLLKAGQVEPGQKILCYIPESGRFTGCFMQLTVV